MKNYMGFTEGMMFGMGRSAGSNGNKILDWDKAKEICLANPTATIEAGLQEDWGYTSGTIFEDGKFTNGYVYVSSTWATPILDVDGEEMECWKWENELPEEKRTSDMPNWWTQQVS